MKTKIKSFSELKNGDHFLAVWKNVEKEEIVAHINREGEAITESYALYTPEDLETPGYEFFKL